MKAAIFFSISFLILSAHGQGVFTLLSDIHQGSPSSQPLKFRALPNSSSCFLFEAAVNNSQSALFVSCGDESNTVELLRFIPFAGHGTGIDFFHSKNATVNNRRLFTLNTSTEFMLWSTDGTIEGTEQITALGSELNFLSYFFTIGNELFFLHEGGGAVRLYKTDGTNDGTTLVRTLCTGGNNCFVQTLHDAFILGNGQAIFFASTPQFGLEPWVSDGTTNGTQVIDVKPGVNGSNFLPYIDGAIMNGQLYFPADNGTGIELFTYNGTSFWKVAEINPTTGNGSFAVHSQPHAFFAHQDYIYFMANDGVEGFEMWASDGTASGTKRLIVTQAGQTERGDIPNYYVFNNKVLFQLSTNNNVNSYNLYQSNGTPNTTSLLRTSQYTHDAFVPLIEFENWLYFKAVNVPGGTQIWRTNATTSAATTLVKTINTNSPFMNLGISSSAPFYALAGSLYFLANSGQNLQSNGRLWKSNGTADNTNPIALSSNITSATNFSIDNLYFNGEHLFFSANLNNLGYELWRYEGNLSLLEEQFLNKIKIFPNPSTDWVTINFDNNEKQDLNFLIYDVQGKIVHQQKTQEAEIKIHVENWTSGVYFVQLAIGNKFYPLDLKITVQ